MSVGSKTAIRFLREGLPNVLERRLLNCSERSEVRPCLSQAERFVRATPHIIRIMIVLAIVLPKANLAYLVLTPTAQSHVRFGPLAVTL